ncbi:hypothetical protein F9Y90_02755 [Borrelia miyamotoi]|uniref:Tetratricopeptide repeat protein n=1 Tax=Borrelia miyamotoi TaxID=47466 RepID=A0AAX3JM11_9SPIR|nr:hypothetical protein [Borrelia miyamotoi]QFP42021.1 hypothetical protein F9Y90_02755 [Borrelia miyamotoi]QFP48137.1 hypothetical protein F9Y91_02750 [Borrelia miyamotoi]QGT55897.1 hypothetical protein GNY89_02760 [Borrelia miyamotoi]QGT56676.1 hypothetical protein GNY88_02760 [Borrelia miyamotoi]WAZ71937.1 hypothetical protein O5404_02800 [Borrelia miyamotoi]
MKKWVLIFLFLVISCGDESKEKTNLGLRIREIELAGGSSLEKIEVYEEFIDKEEQNILRIVNSIDKKTRFFSLIGLEFIKLGQYGSAIEYFNKALEQGPDNYLSHFYIGISSYNLAKGMQTRDKIEEYFILAENSFLKAIAVKDDFNEAIFALSNMYVYDLDKQLEAKGYLSRLESMGENCFEFFMLRGANYYSLGDFDNALLFYNKAKSKALTQEQIEGINRIMNNFK